LANRGRPPRKNNENKSVSASANLIEPSSSSHNEQENVFAAFASVNDVQLQYYNLFYPTSNKSFPDLLIPNDYVEQIKKAKELRNDDLVDRLLRIRQDYFARIKEFKCKNKTQQKFYNDNVLPLIKRFARQWQYEYSSVSEVFSHYSFKKDNKTLMFLRSESGENIKPTEAFGYEMYEIRISYQLKQQIKKLIKEGKIDKLPDYLLKAIDETRQIKDTITLDKENMYRSCNQKSDYELRPKPNLLRIIKSISLRQYLLELDFVNAYASQKTSIIHSKCGTKDKPWAPEKVEKLHKLITERAPGQCFLTTPGDCEIAQIQINLNELFGKGKFEECNKNILDFMGIPIVFVPTQAGGINNQSVIVSLKPFEESIKSDRKIFQEFVNTLCEEINKRNGFTKIPILEYEHTNIRDASELIKELQFLSDRGVLSFEDVCLEFDLDLDEQMLKKKYDWEHRDDQAPVIELSQGTSPMLERKFQQEMELKKSSSSNQNLNDNNQSKNKIKNDKVVGDNSG
jgi:hypothetical protein